MADSSNVIDVLTTDHREVERWFQEYERATSAEDKQRLVNNVIIELVRHSEAEEQVVYPVARKNIPDGGKVIEREIAEHSEAERIMNRLDGMKPDHPEFDERMRDLIRVIRAHVQEEESGWFPQLRAALSEEELTKMGGAVQAAKKISPTHPHPAAPDHPPFNILLGPGAALVDRVRDLLTGRRQQG